MLNLFGSMKAQKEEQKRIEINKALLHHEAKIGGELFGPIPEGHRREFFCLDEHTWVWHEEWTDKQTGKRHVMTTRYDVRPGSILKSQGGQAYQKLSKSEIQNFHQAVTLYGQRVLGEYNRMLYPAA